VYELRVYLSDTNQLGNVYFANYFIWQGKAREEFFRQVTPDPMFFINKKIKMITLEANMKFIKEAFLFDEIAVIVNVTNPKLTTFDLIFIFKNKKTGEMLAEGRQKLGFMNEKGVIIRIPQELVIKGK
jgi:enediyne biosynthesis thioesterase